MNATRENYLIRALGLVSCLALHCSTLIGQGLTGQITGTVLDASGGAVTNLDIVIVNTETGQMRATISNEQGHFVFTQVLPGSFDLTVQAAGFKKHTQKGIAVSATERVTLPRITLEIGEVTEAVTVTASIARVQTESAERAGLIGTRQMEELPLKGRAYISTAKLLPGVIDTANRESPGWNDLVGININGTRSGAINLNLDGITTLDTGSMTGPYLAPSIDAVAEVKVLLSNYQAEYGRSSGGTINTVIKSGTREYHGGAYYYLRNEALNANEFFNNRNRAPRPRYRFNYPGYFLGGPVPLPGSFNKNRDKLFFFWSQEFLPLTTPSGIRTQTFPTERERLGDFSRSLDSDGTVIPIRDPFNNGLQFPDNTIPAWRIDTNGQALLNLLPLPNTVGPGNQYNWTGVSINKQPRRDSILRVDYNVRASTQFYVRLIQDYQAMQGEFGLPIDLGGNNNWPQLPMNYEIHSAGAVATLIHTFSPTQVNEFTFGVNRAKQTVTSLSQERLDANIRAKVGLSGLPQFYPEANPLGLVPNTGFGGIPNAGGLGIEQRFPFFGTNNVWNYADNYSHIVGSHSFKAGLFLERGTRNAARASYFNGSFDFGRNANNPLDSNFAYSNAILGIVNGYTESNAHPAAHGRYVQLEWYAQDTWKANRRLTVDYGVRFYFIQPSLSAGDTLAAFDMAAYDRAMQPPLIQPYIDPSNGVRVGRDPITNQLVPAVKIGAFSSAAGTPYQGMVKYAESVLHNPPVAVAPRIGLAWDLFGNGRTAMRTGFGVFPDRFSDDQVLQLVQSPPLVLTNTANYTTIANLLATPLSLNPTGVVSVERTFKPPVVYNWSFGIQQNIGFGSILDLAYVGNTQKHLLVTRNLNAIPYGTNFLSSSIDRTLGGNLPLHSNFLRPVSGYQDINYLEFSGYGNYHSLQAQLIRRFSDKLTYQMAYTWSKALDLTDGVGGAVHPILAPRTRNYGLAGFDRRHNFTVNYVYSLPTVSRHWNNKFARVALDNWEISGVTTFMTGSPGAVWYSLSYSTDLTGGGGNGMDSRVVLVGDLTRRGPDGQWFNPGAVKPPTPEFSKFGIGNSGKTNFTNPGLNNWDLALYKNFPLGENAARRIQFRLETYNSFNHTQFSGVDTNARFNRDGNVINPNLGYFTSSTQGRRVQLGLKLYF